MAEISVYKSYRQTLDKVYGMFHKLNIQYSPQGKVAGFDMGSEIEFSKKLLSDIDLIIKKGGGTPSSEKFVIARVQSLYNTLVTIHKSTAKDKILGDRIDEYNFAGILKAHKDFLKGAQGSEANSKYKTLYYSPGTNFAMKSALTMGMTPLGAAIGGVADTRNYFKGMGDDFNQSEIGKGINNSKFGKGMSKHVPTLGKIANWAFGDSPGDAGGGRATAGVQSPSTLGEVANDKDTTYGAKKSKGKWYESE